MPATQSPLSALIDLLAMWSDLPDELKSAAAHAAQLLAIAVASVIVAVAFKRMVLTRLETIAASTSNDVDDRLVYFVRRFYNLILLFLATMAGLHLFGVEITPLLAGAGIAGVAVAYAGKDLLGNMIAGGVLLVDQPIKIGDRILLDELADRGATGEWGAWGDVIDIGLRTTTIRNPDGLHVTFPNAKLSEMVIKNVSPRNAVVRFRTRLLLSLDNDLDFAVATLEEVARATPGVLAEPPPQAILRGLYHDGGGHAHQGALLELRVWVQDVRVRPVLRSVLLQAIHRTFREKGIVFARLELSAHPAAVDRPTIPRPAPPAPPEPSPTPEAAAAPSTSATTVTTTVTTT